MTIYSFHLFDRSCEPIFTRHFHPTSHTLTESDLSKLLFGTLYSLRNLSRKLSPDTAAGAVNSGFLSYKTDKYGVHVFESLSLLRFVMMTSPELSRVDTEPVLRQVYATLYVPYIAKNPASLECLYTPDQIQQFNELRFGENMDKRAIKRRKELEKREEGESGSVRRGMGMVVGCELFAMALDQFIGSLPGYQTITAKSTVAY